MKTKTAILVGLLGFLVGQTSVWPCRCSLDLLRLKALFEGRDPLVLPTPEDLASNQVFFGTVAFVAPISESDPGDEGAAPPERIALFDVQRLWSGTPQPQKWVKTPWALSDCGIEFAVGESYLVVAQLATESSSLLQDVPVDLLWTSHCLSQLVEKRSVGRMTEQLDAIASPWVPKPTGNP
jgi:hypothetical protein